MITQNPDAEALISVAGGAMDSFPFLDSSELEQGLRTASNGFRAWRDIEVAGRVDILIAVGHYFRQHREHFARTITAEMRKPLRQARAEVEKCAALCDWYAECGPAMLADEPTAVEGDKAYVSHLPIGVVLAIMPWNFPLWQAMRAAVPVMLAGNGLALKPAPNVVKSARNIEQAFLAAGSPPGAFSMLNLDAEGVARVIADSRIAAVTLTGSVRAGAAVAAEAGRNIKKSVLELGGSDPFIVLADADLDLAAAAAVQARFQNAGQVCIAAKRIIVEEAVIEAFTTRFVALAEKLKVGDPLAEDTDIGPLARRDLRDELASQVARTIAEGASLLLGGTAFDRETGAYYAPTVLSGVTPRMTAFREETFGPVAAIISASDAEDAVALANDSDFGLSGAIWTADVNRARQMARRMHTGGVFINGFAISDPRVPIGGVKKSGYGRELSYFGIREFTNAQVVWQDRR